MRLTESDIMVDGSCPKKSDPPSQPMFNNTAHWAGRALEIVQVERQDSNVSILLII